MLIYFWLFWIALADVFECLLCAAVIVLVCHSWAVTSDAVSGRRYFGDRGVSRSSFSLTQFDHININIINIWILQKWISCLRFMILLHFIALPWSKHTVETKDATEVLMLHFYASYSISNTFLHCWFLVSPCTKQTENWLKVIWSGDSSVWQEWEIVSSPQATMIFRCFEEVNEMNRP